MKPNRYLFSCYVVNSPTSQYFLLDGQAMLTESKQSKRIPSGKIPLKRKENSKRGRWRAKHHQFTTQTFKE
jgi:hypothetical protein